MNIKMTTDEVLILIAVVRLVLAILCVILGIRWMKKERFGNGKRTFGNKKIDVSENLSIVYNKRAVLNGFWHDKYSKHLILITAACILIIIFTMLDPAKKEYMLAQCVLLIIICWINNINFIRVHERIAEPICKIINGEYDEIYIGEYRELVNKIPSDFMGLFGDATLDKTYLVVFDRNNRFFMKFPMKNTVGKKNILYLGVYRKDDIRVVGNNA